MTIEERITINAGIGYDVWTSPGLLMRAGKILALSKNSCKVMVVTDSNVAPLYAESVLASLNDSGFNTYTHILKAGEESKNPENYFLILNSLAISEFTREDVVFALGGGVVGDIAGFAAATYMRGIDVIQAPTTLLAMIDSSIGGKTGVDLPEGKNLVGAFHQPSAVLCDINALETLADSEFKNGIGEGIKYAVLAGGHIYKALFNGIDRRNCAGFIRGCQLKKAEIVEADERESGMRKLLNLGHTIGHAEEKLSGYKIKHGEAVAAGIGVMAGAAFKAGELEKNDYDDICALLHMYDLYRRPAFSSDQMKGCLALDKKSDSRGGISVVKILGIGNCVVEKMSLNEFGTYISEAEKL